MNPWQAAELGAFLDHVAPHRLASLFEVVAFTGLRRNEALGLRWPDLDFEAGVMVVQQQLARVKNGAPTFAPPKSSSGDNIIIQLSQATIGALMAHRLAQEAERELWGTGYVDHGLVFARENGRPYEPTSVTKTFRMLAVEAGLRPVRLHDLRHSSIAITHSTCVHLLEGVGRAAAESAWRSFRATPKHQGSPAVTTS